MPSAARHILWFRLINIRLVAAGFSLPGDTMGELRQSLEIKSHTFKYWKKEFSDFLNPYRGKGEHRRHGEKGPKRRKVSPGTEIFSSVKSPHWRTNRDCVIGIPYSYISLLACIKTNVEGTYNIELIKNQEKIVN